MRGLGATAIALRSPGLLRRFASRNDGAGRERRRFPTAEACMGAGGRPMHSLRRAIGIALTLFAASVIGMALQWVVPGQVLTEAKGTVGAMVGLVTLLLALVLGLLVFTAFSVFTTQRDEAQSLGPIIVELDVALEQYGPGAALGRVRLREALARSRARFFGDARHGPRPWTLDEMRATIQGMGSYFDSLQPATDAQRRLADLAR